MTKCSKEEVDLSYDDDFEAKHENTPSPNPEGNHQSDDFKSWKRLVFNTKEHAEICYRRYCRSKGFDVHICSHHRKSGRTLNIEWECNHAGFRSSTIPPHEQKRKPKPDIKCGCLHRCRLAYERSTGTYRFTNFIEDHNHKFASVGTHLKIDRGLNISDKVFLAAMNESGIRTCHSINLMERLQGGLGSLLFTRKDVYNFLNQERLQIIKRGDINVAIGFLEGMKLDDPDLVFDYTLGEDGSLSRLFWADGFSRASYVCFGDVLIMDSTYQTNKYQYPLIIISGVDNHLHNVIFGAALVCKENKESYEWVLRKFLECMGGRAPPSVVTDQDGAMKAAIRKVFPNAKHRLCGWHLHKNCIENVHNEQFQKSFGNLMRKESFVEEFEEEWRNTTEGLNSSWINETYNKRESWCEAYFRGHFMEMTRTTQRAESLNSSFKDIVQVGRTITELLRYYHYVLSGMRVTFHKDQLACEMEISNIRRNEPLRVLQLDAASMYTKSAFVLVHAQILDERSYIVEKSDNSDENVHIYTVKRFRASPDKQRIVIMNLKTDIFQCECLKLESDGLPCRHLFAVFKQLHLEKIPRKCILERWTTKIAIELHAGFPRVFVVNDPQKLFFMQVYKGSMGLCSEASQSEAVTQNVLKRLHYLTEEASKEVAEERAKQKPKLSGEDEIGCGVDARDPARVSQKASFVDPRKIKSRGAPPMQKQNCKACGMGGHKKTTCKNKPKENDVFDEDIPRDFRENVE